MVYFAVGMTFIAAVIDFATVIWFADLSQSPNFDGYTYTQLSLQRAWSFIAIGMYVLADLLITSALCYYLMKTRSNAPSSRSRFMIKEIVQMFITTCALTFTNSLGVLITYAASLTYSSKPTLSFLCLTMVHQKIYAITFLYVLNSRPNLQAKSREIPLTLGISTMGEQPSDSNGATDDFSTNPSMNSNSRKSWRKWLGKDRPTSNIFLSDNSGNLELGELT